jgi:hypothetical protein
MAISTGPHGADRSASGALESTTLRLVALGGILGLVLRFVSSDTLTGSRFVLNWDPQGGIARAVAETLGVALIAVTLFAAYRALADRRLAQRAAAIGVAASLGAASVGLDLAFDGALVGALVLGIGIGIAARGTQSAIGWIGIVAGIVAFVTALPTPAFEPVEQSREVMQIAALSMGLFVAAVSVALWRQAEAASANDDGADR